VSSRNRELTERAFEALGRRDLDAFLELVDPEVEFTSLIAEAEGQIFRGHDGVRDWWERVADSMGGLDFRIDELEEIGELVIVRVRVTGTIGDVPVSQTMYQALRAREGRAVWWHTVRTREEALAAAEVEK
jgi:ketosteroid isomerase-like protein